MKLAATRVICKPNYILWVNFLYNTPFRRNHQKSSVCHPQKLVIQISILPKTLFN